MEWALKSTIIAPSGPNKSRLLAVLANDEAMKGVAHYDILSKMFRGERINIENIETFKESLEEYQ